jgi:thiol-disulfide isomerase/thioredoxin
LALAALLAIGGGYLLSQSDNDDPDVDARLDANVNTAVPSLAPNSAVGGEALPSVDLRTSDGGSVSTGQLLGRPLVVNFWYSTCAPCKKELPDIATVHRDLGNQVRFVGVNPLDPDLGVSFAEGLGVTYELYGGEQLAAEVGIANYPVTLLVDASGTIVHQTGVVDEASLRTLIDEHLR